LYFYTLKFNNRTVEGHNFEILDHVEVDFTVPSLSESLGVISAAYERANRMLSKLDAFFILNI